MTYTNGRSKMPIRRGEVVEFSRTVSEADVYLFAAVSGDSNEDHIDATSAVGQRYGRIAHGAYLVALMSTASAMLHQRHARATVSAGYDRVRFIRPVPIGTTVSVRYEVDTVDEERGRAEAAITITNELSEVVAVARHLMAVLDDQARPVAPRLTSRGTSDNAGAATPGASKESASKTEVPTVVASGEVVTWERRGAVALVTLRSPPLNILTWSLRSQVLGAIRRAFDDDEVRVAVICSGLARAFSAGADINEFVDSLRPGGGRERCGVEHQTYDEIEFGPKPVLCAINGYCLGGGLELAMATDIRIAAADATLGMPEITLSCFPGGGGTERLALIVGRTLAKEMMWTGRRLSAEEASRAGLVSRVVQPGELLEATLEFANQVASGSPRAVLAVKQLVDEATGARAAIAGALPRVAPWVEEMYMSDEVRRAVTAFTRRRQARAEAPKPDQPAETGN